MRRIEKPRPRLGLFSFGKWLTKLL